MDGYKRQRTYFSAGKFLEWMGNCQKRNSPSVNSWSGVAFERVCLEHITEIKKALGISGVFTETNAWACSKDDELGLQGSQIDLLIVRKDQIINVCEIRRWNYWRNKPDLESEIYDKVY